MDQTYWDQINRIGDAQLRMVVGRLVEQLVAGDKIAQVALQTSELHRNSSGHPVVRSANLQKRLEKILPAVTIKTVTCGTIPARSEYVIVISVE